MTACGSQGWPRRAVSTIGSTPSELVVAPNGGCGSRDPASIASDLAPAAAATAQRCAAMSCGGGPPPWTIYKMECPPNVACGPRCSLLIGWTTLGAPSQAPPGSRSGGSEATWVPPPSRVLQRAGRLQSRISTSRVPLPVTGLPSKSVAASTSCRHVFDRRPCHKAGVPVPAAGACCAPGMSTLLPHAADHTHREPGMPELATFLRLIGSRQFHHLPPFASSQQHGSQQPTALLVCAPKPAELTAAAWRHAPHRRPLDRSLPALFLRLREHQQSAQYGGSSGTVHGGLEPLLHLRAPGVRQ